MASTIGALGRTNAANLQWECSLSPVWWLWVVVCVAVDRAPGVPEHPERGEGLEAVAYGEAGAARHPGPPQRAKHQRPGAGTRARSLRAQATLCIYICTHHSATAPAHIARTKQTIIDPCHRSEQQKLFFMRLAPFYTALTSLVRVLVWLPGLV